LNRPKNLPAAAFQRCCPPADQADSTLSSAPGL
jgi:hypothetical protein